MSSSLMIKNLNIIKIDAPTTIYRYGDNKIVYYDVSIYRTLKQMLNFDGFISIWAFNNGMIKIGNVVDLKLVYGNLVSTVMIFDDYIEIHDMINSNEIKLDVFLSSFHVNDDDGKYTIISGDIKGFHIY